jgi:hypothetical protein
MTLFMILAQLARMQLGYNWFMHEFRRDAGIQWRATCSPRSSPSHAFMFCLPAIRLCISFAEMLEYFASSGVPVQCSLLALAEDHVMIF